MNSSVAVARPKQAPITAAVEENTRSAAKTAAMFKLILRLALRLLPCTSQHFRTYLHAARSRRSGNRHWTASPALHHQRHQAGSGQKIENRHQPGDQAKSGLGRFDICQ